MVLAADGLLDKGLLEDLAADDDGIVVLADDNVGIGPVGGELEAGIGLEEGAELGADVGAAVARDGEAAGSGDAKVVEDGEDAAAVPEELLEGEIVDADGGAEFDVVDGLGEGKVGAEEGDEDVTEWPVVDLWGRQGSERDERRKGGK